MYITDSNARARLKTNFDKFYPSATRDAEFADDVSKAEGFVNGYIGKRYVIPPSGSALDTVTSLALDLLEGFAWKRGGAGSQIPDNIKDNVAAALRILADYSTGKAVLMGGTYAASPGNMGTPVAVVEGDDAVFTNDRLQGLL
jgi:hypothetical protein